MPKRSRQRPGKSGIYFVGLGVCVTAAMVAQESTKRPWYEVDTSWISAGLGFAAMDDGAFYSQDAESKQQVGDLSSEQLFRLDNLSISGEIELCRPWRYVFAGNYRGLEPTVSRTWTSTDLNLSIPIGALGWVTLGKQKEGVGLEMMANARDIDFMELSTMTTASTFFESHIVGVRFSGTAAGERMTWSAGWFNNWLDDDLSFSESGQIAAGRVTGTPILAGGGRRLLHLGFSAVYRQAPNGSLKSRRALPKSTRPRISWTRARFRRITPHRWAGSWRRWRGPSRCPPNIRGRTCRRRRPGTPTSRASTSWPRGP